MSETEVAYKKAFIKYVNVDLPKLMKQKEREIRAMNLLSNKIGLMPTTIRVRY